MAETTSGTTTADARRNAIAAAALGEFSDSGFSAARIEDVARRAGIAKGTLYLYYDSKEALFEAVVKAYVVPVIQRVEAMYDDAPASAESLLRAQIAFLYDSLVAGELRHILRMMVAEGARFPKLLEFYYQAVIQRGMNAIRRTLELGARRGDWRQTAAHAFPQVIAGPAIMSAVWKLLFDDFHALDLEGMKEAHLDIVLNGLKT